MSYDLAFWEGPRPRDNDEASAVFEQLWGALEESEDDLPPTPAIQALVETLEARWPGTDPEAPWATFPLAEDAQGATLYVNLVFGRPDQDLEVADVHDQSDLGPVLGVHRSSPSHQAHLLFAWFEPQRMWRFATNEVGRSLL